MSVQYYFVEEENASYKVLIIKYLNRYIELQKDSFAINVFSDEQLEEEWKMISHRAEISDIFLPIEYI